MAKINVPRRRFIKGTLASGVVLSSMPLLGFQNFLSNETQMKLGLVTYLWAKDWTVEEIIDNCEKSGIQGVELRSTHAHGVELSLSKKERLKVKNRFKNSGVTLVGIGSAEEFDQKDPILLSSAIKNTKEFIKLSHDVGGSGVKVRPNHLHDDVPHEQTIEQIGKALNEVARYGADYGQEIRVEVHGKGTQNPEIMKRIMDVAHHPNVSVCWNCNQEDLDGKGFGHNFDLLKDRLGRTTHIRELNSTDYPYDKLLDELVEINYDGWLLLECRTAPADTLKAMTDQKRLFDEMIRKRSK
ncbi:sugar phosphate isomerase/epimerase [Zobellia amurskyensis]|uniref:Sugar phosphate isomerase/epimerase n=1 Tax=Zobellia amurskyensis TaxID=248905 RepID=A0A7X3D0R3_9FLAO|nr:TIM barrel protein [Zobellia amurskyensis]MUH34641.1 sugar phosphate isomerase/epimerase [Zobellia amurskyensis]